MMTTDGDKLEIWASSIDSMVESMLANQMIESPPVNAIEVAHRLGITVAIDAAQPTRARQKSLSGERVIFLKPDSRPERLQWAAAHELGEVHAWQIFEMAGVDPKNTPEGTREQVANLFATRFLLPERWFPDNARRLDFDLYELKKRYATASHELIARRMLDVEPELVLTIIDKGKTTTRVNGHGRRFPKLMPEEQAVWRECHETGTKSRQSGIGYDIRGWAIHEPDWKREILLSHFTEEYGQDTEW